MRSIALFVTSLVAVACREAPAPVVETDLAQPAIPAWLTERPLPSARQECAVVTLGDRIYVIGGFSASIAVVADVDAYDPATQTFSARAPLPRPLHHVNAVAVDGHIWVIGGLSGLSFTAVGSIYRYDPVADAWEERGTMPAGQERGSAFVAAKSGLVYLAGGLRGGAAVTDCATFAPAVGAWKGCAPLATPRDHGVGVILGDSFVIVGGRDTGITTHSRSVDAYDDASDSWSAHAPMPTSRGGLSGSVVDGRLLVAGGEGAPNDSGVFAEVELYDPATNAWSVLPPMRTPRHGTGAATIGRTVYIPGGATKQAFGATNTHEALAL